MIHIDVSNGLDYVPHKTYLATLETRYTRYYVVAYGEEDTTNPGFVRLGHPRLSAIGQSVLPKCNVRELTVEEHNYIIERAQESKKYLEKAQAQANEILRVLHRDYRKQVSEAISLRITV